MGFPRSWRNSGLWKRESAGVVRPGDMDKSYVPKEDQQENQVHGHSFLWWTFLVVGATQIVLCDGIKATSEY